METQQSVMAKTPGSGGSATSKPTSTERRGTRRCKITQLMRIRPSDPEKEHFDDMRGTLSVSRSGVYFQSSEPLYELGMRLFVTMPYSQNTIAMNQAQLYLNLRKCTRQRGGGTKPWKPFNPASSLRGGTCG